MSWTIRRRLTLAVLAFTAPVLAAGAWALFALVSGTVRDGFDRDLSMNARVLADLAEQDEAGFEFELDPGTARLLASDEPLAVQVWRPDGSVLFRSREDLELPRPDGPAGTASLDHAGPRLRTASLRFLPRVDLEEPGAAVSAAPMTITVARPTARVDRLLGGLRTWFAIVTGLLVVASAWLIGRGVAVGLAPLDRVSRDIEGLDSSDPDARLATEPVSPELQPLVDRVNGLLARHQEAFGRERRFTADAAHELRTPLAVLRTEIEVALRRDRDAAAHRRVLEGALETVVGMTRCVDALLLIARAEGGRVPLRPEPVAVDDLVAECWRPHAAEAARRGLALETDADATVDVDRDLFRLIASNLVANAVGHGDPDSVVRVASAPERGVLLAVSNRAADLTGDDLPHLFERFWRREDARTDTQLHSGLGLSLVASLAARAGLETDADLSAGVLTITVLQPEGDPT